MKGSWRSIASFSSQKCTDELFHFLVCGNQRRLENILLDPRYPWQAWAIDLLESNRPVVTPAEDLAAALLQHPLILERLKRRFLIANWRSLFIRGSSPANWNDWRFLTGCPPAIHYIPTWLSVACVAQRRGLCLQVGIRVSYDGEADSMPEALSFLAPAIAESATHVRRGLSGPAPSFQLIPLDTCEHLPLVRGGSFAAALATVARLDRLAGQRAAARSWERWQHTLISADVAQDGTTLESVGLCDAKYDAACRTRSLRAMLVAPHTDFLPAAHRRDLSVFPVASVDGILNYLYGGLSTIAAAPPEIDEMDSLVRDTLDHVDRAFPAKSILNVPPVPRIQLRERVLSEIRSHHQGILVVGGMGTGKSLLLADIARRLARTLHSEDHVSMELPELPLFYHASEFSESVPQLLADRLQETFGPFETIDELAARTGFSSLVLCIDGLNEIDFSEELAEELDRYARAPGASCLRVIACCRPERLGAWRRRSRLFATTVEMGPFSDEELLVCYNQVAAVCGTSILLPQIPPVTRERLKTPLLHTLFHRTYADSMAADLPVHPPLSLPLQFCRAFLHQLAARDSRLFSYLRRWGRMLMESGTNSLTRAHCHELAGRSGRAAFDHLETHGFLVPAEQLDAEGEPTVQLPHPGFTAYLLYAYESGASGTITASEVRQVQEQHPLLLQIDHFVVQEWIENDCWDDLVHFLADEPDALPRHLAVLTSYVDMLDDACWEALASVHGSIDNDGRLEFELWERLALRGKGARRGRAIFWEAVLRQTHTPEARLRCLSLLCRSGLLPNVSFSLDYCVELDQLLHEPKLSLAARVVGRYVLADMAANRPQAVTTWHPLGMLAQVQDEMDQLSSEDWHAILPSRLHDDEFVAGYAAYVRGYLAETTGKVTRRLTGTCETVLDSYRQATRCFQRAESLALLRDVSQTGISRVWHNEMTYNHYQGNFEAAIVSAQKRFDQTLRSHNLDDCSDSAARFAELLVSLGEYQVAADWADLAERLNQQAVDECDAVGSLLTGLQAALLQGARHTARQWDQRIVQRIDASTAWSHDQTFRHGAADESAHWGALTWVRLLLWPEERCYCQRPSWRTIQGNLTLENLFEQEPAVIQAVLSHPPQCETFAPLLRRFAALVIRNRAGEPIAEEADAFAQDLIATLPVAGQRITRLASLLSVSFPGLRQLEQTAPLPLASVQHHYAAIARGLLNQITVAWPAY